MNRLSIGAQSFSELHLRDLGRVHTAAEIDAAMQAARSAGFSNLNLDVMHGLPGQNVAEAVADLERALAWEPSHLSWYQLTIETQPELLAVWRLRWRRRRRARQTH